MLLAIAHVLLAIAHVPLAIAHVPLAISHALLAISHALLAISHALLAISRVGGDEGLFLGAGALEQAEEDFSGVGFSDAAVCCDRKRSSRLDL